MASNSEEQISKKENSCKLKGHITCNLDKGWLSHPKKILPRNCFFKIATESEAASWF